MKWLLIIALVFMLLSPPAQALEMLSGNDISVDSPIDDDVFAAGGEIEVNAEVGGKIVAAGGEIDLKDAAKNAVLAGGTVTIHPDAVISRDAVISGGTVSNAGTIMGNLTVRAKQFQNTGTAGYVDFQQTEGLQGFQEVMNIVHILMIIGFLILGIILLKVFPAQFLSVEEEVRTSPLRDTVVGFALIIVSMIAIFILAITVIGFPVAAVLGMLVIIARMLSSLVVSFALGRTILNLFNVKTTDILIFVLGFIVLSVLYRIPYAGGVICLIALCLGFGAIVYAVRNNWQRITSPSA